MRAGRGAPGLPPGARAGNAAVWILFHHGLHAYKFNAETPVEVPELVETAAAAWLGSDAVAALRYHALHHARATIPAGELRREAEALVKAQSYPRGDASSSASRRGSAAVAAAAGGAPRPEVGKRGPPSEAG